MSELLNNSYQLPISWNRGFNEAAALCGLSAVDLLAMPEPSQKIIDGVHWERRGEKISVSIGNGFFTVSIEDIQATSDQSSFFFVAAAQAGIQFVDIQCLQQAKPEVQ